MSAHLDCCDRALELAAQIELLRLRLADAEEAAARWISRVQVLETRLGAAREALEDS